MNKKLLYTKAYRELNNQTPLKSDCGMLCEKACCKGDEDSGMYLFPGEDVMLSSASDFLSIKPTNLYNLGGTPVLLAVCGGWCNRRMRPLSCRIFPLTPYLQKNGILDVIIDPRARTICPLAVHKELIKPDSLFRKKVRSVFRLLMQDDDIMQFVQMLSRILDDYML